MMEFLSMGGYARYVWSAFGVSFTVIVAMLWLTRRHFNLTKKTLLRRLRSTEGTQI
jgi:heme exporter protein CcmD